MRQSIAAAPEPLSPTPDFAARPTAASPPMPVHTLPAFAFESGDVFSDVPVAYHAWGALDAEGRNAVVVCHALTGSADAGDWWAPLVGPGRVLDTERFFVVCANVLASPYGTLSPLTPDPATGRHYGRAFPVPTVRDTVRLHRALLDALGVRSVALATGGSMGGMQVLEWGFETALDGAPFVRALAPIAVGARHSAWCIAWSEAQRLAVAADPAWDGGDPHAASAGLAAARAMAMVSYRSAEAFALRHARQRSVTGAHAGAFSVASYLRHQGRKLVARFDPVCYVRITEMMDTHDVARGRTPGGLEEGSDAALAAVLGTLPQPVLAVGIDSDVLYLPGEAREIARLVPNGTYAEIASPWGHDAFLIEFAQIERLLRDGWSESEAR